MTTLTKCIKKAGKSISVDDAQQIKADKASYIADGMSQVDATNQAVIDYINSVSDERVAFEAEVAELGGQVDPSPFTADTIIGEIIAEKVAAQEKITAEKKVAAQEKITAEKKVAVKISKDEQAHRDLVDSVAKMTGGELVGFAGRLSVDKTTDKSRVKELDAAIDARLAAIKTERADKHTQDRETPVKVQHARFDPPSKAVATPAEQFLEDALKHADGIRGVLQAIHDKSRSTIHKNVIKLIMKTVPADTKIVVVGKDTKLPKWVVLQEIETKFDGDPGIKSKGGGFRNASAAAHTDRTTGQVTIYIKDSSFQHNGLTDEAVIHEAIHGALVTIIRDGERGADPAATKAFERLAKVQRSTLRAMRAGFRKGTISSAYNHQWLLKVLEDPHEFMTWGLTNPDVQMIMMNLPIGKTTAWSKFTRWVAETFGMVESDHNVLLELMDTTQQFVEARFEPALQQMERVENNTSGDVVQSRETEESLPLATVEEVEYTDEYEEYFRSTQEAAQVDATVSGRAPRENWAEATRIRGSDGRPATYFRGSQTSLISEHFGAKSLGYQTDHPSAALGVWFSNTELDAMRYGTMVEEFQFDIQNPMTMDGADLPGFETVAEAVAFRKALVSKGHDGLVLDFTEMGGPVQLVAFKADNVIPTGQVIGLAGRVQAAPDKFGVDIQLSEQPVVSDKTSSFERATETVQHSFDVAQMENELAIAEHQRDYRQDIKAGRRAKELKAQIKNTNRDIFKLNAKDPQLNGKIPGTIGSTVDRVIAQSSRETLRQRTSKWMKDHLSWAGIRAVVGRGLITDVYDIEQGELAKHGKRLLGAMSPTVLVHEAKNALVTASIAINQFGLKMVNKQVVVNEEQLGLEPILEPIAKLGNKYLRLWEAYIVVKRSERLMGEGRENFVLDDEIQAIKDWVESKPNLHMLFENTQRDYMEFNRSNLELAVESGWINNEDAFGGQLGMVYDKEGNAEPVYQPDGTLFPLNFDLDTHIRAEYGAEVDFEVMPKDGWYHDDYVPFNRLDEATGHQKGLGHTGKIGQVRKGVIGLKGGIGAIPVIENMVKNTTFLISGAMRTVAMQETVKLFGNVTVSELPASGAPVMITDDYAKQLAAEMEIDLDAMDTAERQRWIRMMQAASPYGRDTVVVYNNGRPTYYRVEDPHLLAAIKNIGPNQLQGFMKVLGFPTRLLSATITRMPAFLVSNLIRELQNAFVINEKGSVNPIVSIGKGLRNFTKLIQGAENPEMKAMMAAGAVSFNSYYNSAPVDVHKRLTKIGINKSALRRVVESPFSGVKSAWDFYIRVAAATEHANRLTVRQDYIKAEKKALKKEGLEDSSAEYASRMQNAVAEANYRALDVLNFSRRGGGVAADLLMATMPFINPRIQGLDRLYRGAKESPGVFITKSAILTAAAVSLAAWNWEENEEEMDKLKEEDKDLWYHFFIENPDGSKDHYRIPKGFEIGQITGTLPERIIEQMRTDQPEAVSDSFIRFMGVTFGLSAPQVIKPALEIGFNRDFFRQRPVMSYGQSRALPMSQVDAWTSKVIIDIARSMPDSAPDWAKSPKKLEHLFKGYLGPMGAMVLEGSNDLYEMTGNAPDAPAKDLSQRYLIRNFLRSGSERASRHVNRFYSMLDETGKIAASLNQAKKDRDTSLYSEIKLSNAEKIKIRKSLNRMSKTMSSYTKRVKSILIDPDMDGQKKFEELQRLTQLKNKLAKRATDKYWDIFK